MSSIVSHDASFHCPVLMKRKLYQLLCRARPRLVILFALFTGLVYFSLLNTITVKELTLGHKDDRHRTKLISSKTCHSKVNLLILVSSYVGNAARRKEIRFTWGTDFLPTPRWRTVFLIGANDNQEEMRLMAAEDRLYGDLITSEYREGFFNMSYKVAMGFEWAMRYCPFDFMLKSDDDVFVNPYAMLQYLAKSAPRSNLYMGNPMIFSPVLRSGRYAVSEQELNKTYFEPYCSGGGILMSSDVVRKFMEFYDVQAPLKIDDAYLGELAKKAGVPVKENGNFRMYEDSCVFRNWTLVQHPAKGDCLQKLYKGLQDVLSTYDLYSI
ncbi:UDP-GlcNAc:betaGal beta-1,3-N-acetylglucosaminyltransferase 7-like isoform X1 [Nematostella vectensis]|uniref:UDP-GlcNAc:betaGal beta-1,3-N-acetylglucosaminyltransferase 7-like isoform X1 n=2 Tax=Nematostella vectensis TaxID=45351 RepID=UPI0020770240|nr:UDP-GlcNAc:betaGal beta-1,3-N-acetylglucosaminyltransferase 7-like isoform X1 [Nematostella vectensis]